MTAFALVDTHAHLCAAEFAHDLADVLERARRAGVAAIVAVGETLADAERTLSLAQSYPMVRPAAGLYPTVLDPAQAQAVEAFIRANRHRLAAVGEVGLDHWMVKTDPEREVQRTIFAGFIRLAIELDLPLNIHSRSAGRDAVTLLLDSGARRVHLHAFDGRAAAALPGAEAGYFSPSALGGPFGAEAEARAPPAARLPAGRNRQPGPRPGTRRPQRAGLPAGRARGHCPDQGDSR